MERGGGLIGEEGEEGLIERLIYSSKKPGMETISLNCNKLRGGVIRGQDYLRGGGAK